jgi:hypothetical protein
MSSFNIIHLSIVPELDLDELVLQPSRNGFLGVQSLAVILDELLLFSWSPENAC